MHPLLLLLSCVQVDQADIDIVLVGDSVSMVVHGHDTTLPITLDDMLSHCKAVARGATRAFLVGDLPFGSYEVSTSEAVRSAIRMLKEGGMDAVKLEGEQLKSMAVSNYRHTNKNKCPVPSRGLLLFAPGTCAML